MLAESIYDWAITPNYPEVKTLQLPLELKTIKLSILHNPLVSLLRYLWFLVHSSVLVSSA